MTHAFSVPLIIAGSRDLYRPDLVAEGVEAWTLEYGLEPSVVISGAAPGMDTAGEAWAARHDVFVVRYPADWKQGRKAGPDRNQKMADHAALYSGGLLCIHTGGRGSADMLRRARMAGLKIVEWRVG